MELVFLGVLILLMIIALSSGFPVAFALPGSAIGAIAIAAFCGYVFTGDSSSYFAQDGPVQWLTAGITNFRSLYWEVERDTLIAIPLFVFMGIMLQRSKIAEDLLVAMAQLFGPVPGGLGISVVFVGALLAATTGILGATVIAMGLISLPAMIRHNYSKPLATGTICASGTLGQIIPPSIVLIILADQLANAADQARTMRAAEYKQSTGEFSMPPEMDITSASAGDMFMGALVPGLVLVGLYMLYILVRALLKPEVAPPVPHEGQYDRKFFISIGMSLIPPLTLIFAVLGSIVTGIATVNQAGAIGAVGAIVMGGYRLSPPGRRRYVPLLVSLLSLVVIFVLQKTFDLNVKNITSQSDMIGVILAAIAVAFLVVAVLVSTWRTFRIDDTLRQVMIETAKTTTMVFIILIGAAMLTAAFRGFGGEHLVRDFLTGLPGGFWTQFLVVMLVIFLLGFFLDFIEIAVVVVPIVAPILLADPSANVTAVWLGVMVGLNIQTSFLTPPFGFALFYLRGVAPKTVKTTHIYKGATAFIALQLLGLAIAGYFPGLVNYMPNRTFLTSETAPPPVNPKLQACIEEQIFPLYLEEEDRIVMAIDKARRIDLSPLPDRYREPLHESFDLALDTFALVDESLSARTSLDAYVEDYKPLHATTRQIQIRVRSIDRRIKQLETRLRRLERDGADEQEIERFKNSLYELGLERRTLIDRLPPQWEEQRAEYKALEKADKSSRVAYRRNVDAAYEPLQKVLAVLKEQDALAGMKDDVERLRSLLEAGVTPENLDHVIEQFKLTEIDLGALAGVNDIRSSLTASRRAVSGEEVNVSEAIALHEAAVAELERELSWRKSADGLRSALGEYDEAIRDTIGLRLQRRLTQDQAEDVASCLSGHRDISMSF
ncbi:MAG: TRAP transporter large permease subunit [Gammaproteobacteria bacterium]|nr:TRAP transporter large permease subunit [Gammaproteobacteria bacterium]MYD75830.1 TRAP transporter large permease subunit [Gammaproteobacteria bacterium]MYJ52095.1 TRAP transporter large permease subunit [Gammaproteobacteria bacterium]